MLHSHPHPLSARFYGRTTLVELPHITAATDPGDYDRIAAADLLAHSAANPRILRQPLRCRYRLYDRRGRLVYTSRGITLGPAAPQVCTSFSVSYGRWVFKAMAAGDMWRVDVDRDRLVPRRLRHLAARAVVEAVPDVPSGRGRRVSLTLDEFDLDPSDAPLLLPQSGLSAPHLLPRSENIRNFASMNPRPATNEPLPQTVAAAIAAHGLLNPGDKVAVALSGGADSVALLAALASLGYDCTAVHCNFHLRGEESMRDMRHAEAVCRTLGVDLIVRDFDVAARRAATHESVEMACRSLRYGWFDSLVGPGGFRAVAVGHHAEDNVETVLLNLLRGTGIDGLRGIRYRRGFIIRPMLDCTRAQIEDYLASRSLGFVVDSSNASDAHLRNRLRNHVIPLMLSHFPAAMSTILSSSANIDAAARIYHRAIDDYRSRYVSPDGSVDVGSLAAALGADAPAVLREFLAPLGVTPSQCADILAGPCRAGVRFVTPSGHCLELDRGRLSLPSGAVVSSAGVHQVDLRRDILSPLHIRVERHDVAEFRPRRDPSVLYLDASALDPSRSWQLRRWRKGDRIRPFGLQGSRLVSDLFSDARYSAADKRDAWLLTCDGDIVWVVGLRQSALFPVTPLTRNYIQLTLSPPLRP